MTWSAISKRCIRLWRHLRVGSGFGRRAFPPATLDAIQAAIAHGEQVHSAEVRMIVESSLSASAILRGTHNRQRALTLFAEYGVWDTEDNCGVLIYVNLAERKVDIVADRNVGRKIDPREWRTVCRTMTAGYARADYHASTLAALAQLHALLSHHFPATGPRPNQLPDRPLVL